MNPILLFSGIYSFIFLFGESVRMMLPKNKELSRKVVHFLCGLSSLFLPYFIQSHWTVLLLVSLFSLIMIFSKKKNLLKSIHGVSRNSWGSLYFPAAIYLLFLLSSNDPVIYIISILVLTISDAFAALVGSTYGKIKYDVEGNSKSLEGSAVFFFLTFLCIHIPLLLLTDIGRIDSLIIPLIIAILVTAFEAISPSGSDNIIIPFGTYYLLNKMTHLPLQLVIDDLYLLIFIAFITALLSIFKTSGLIAIMLLNYAAITLCDIYWFWPLFTGQFIFYLVLWMTREEKKSLISLKPLFYLGLAPTLLIFAANTFGSKQTFFLPYLTIITAEALIVYKNHQKKNLLSWLVLFLAFLFLSLPLFFYLPTNQIGAFFLLLLGCIIAYILDKKLNQGDDPIVIYRTRFFCTCGSGIFIYLFQRLL